MTDEEIKKLIEFLLKHQAGAEELIEFLLEQQAKHQASQVSIEKSMEFLLEQQAKAEVETQEMHDAIRELTANAGQLDAAIVAMQAEANADRQVIREVFSEFRTDIGRLVDNVESDRKTVRAVISALSNGVTEDRRLFREVARLAKSSEKRLTMLEARVDKIENLPDTP